MRAYTINSTQSTSLRVSRDQSQRRTSASSPSPMSACYRIISSLNLPKEKKEPSWTSSFASKHGSSWRRLMSDNQIDFNSLRRKCNLVWKLFAKLNRSLLESLKDATAIVTLCRKLILKHLQEFLSMKRWTDMPTGSMSCYRNSTNSKCQNCKTEDWRLKSCATESRGKGREKSSCKWRWTKILLSIISNWMRMDKTWTS